MNLARLLALKMSDWPLDDGYSRAHFSRLALNFQLTGRAQMAETLLNVHHKMVSVASQDALVQALAPALLKPCRFLLVNEEHTLLYTNLLGPEAALSSCTIPSSFLNDPKARQRLHDLCTTLTLRLGRTISGVALLESQSQLRTLPGERIFLQTTIQNELQLELTLYDMVLHFRASGDQDRGLVSIRAEDTNIKLPAASTATLTLSFSYETAEREVLLRLVRLEAAISDQVRLYVEIQGRGPRLNFTKEQRLSASYANNPSLCFAVVHPGPRLSLELERTDTSSSFEGSEIQATAIIHNTGDGPARDCRLFATGIDAFPPEGLQAGTIGAASSVQIPLAYGVADEPLLVAICDDRDPSSRATFVYASAPAQLAPALSVRTLVVGELLLLSLTNDTGRFMSNVTPTLSTAAATIPCRIPLPTPPSANLAPGHAAIFTYSGCHAEQVDDDAASWTAEGAFRNVPYTLSVDLDIGEVSLRILVKDLEASWPPPRPLSEIKGHRVQLERIGETLTLLRDLPLSAAPGLAEPWGPRVMASRGSTCEAILLNPTGGDEQIFEFGAEAFYYQLRNLSTPAE